VIIKIIGISGSPRRGSNTEVLVKEALKGAQKIKDVETDFLSLAGKNIEHCKGCLACQKQNRICVIRDDFQEFFKAYMKADGIIIGSPVYHLSITSCLKAAIERLGQSLFSIYQGEQPLLFKVGGAIAQGNSIYGGQEFALQFIINSFILENCIVVSGNSSQSKLGVPASTFSDSKQGSIRKNKNAISLSRGLGERVAEMAHIINIGIKHYYKETDSKYFERRYLKYL